jgi:hypothetical protein
MYISIFYVLTQSFVKNKYFHGLGKNIKKNTLQKGLFFYQIFVIFTDPTYKVGFSSNEFVEM